MAKPTHPVSKVILLNILLTLFYSLLRLQYLIWNWHQFKTAPHLDLLWAFIMGIRFDLSVVFTLSVPALLLAITPWPVVLRKYQISVLALLHLIFQFPFLVINKIDIELVNFIGRRTTYDSLFLS